MIFCPMNCEPDTGNSTTYYLEVDTSSVTREGGTTAHVICPLCKGAGFIETKTETDLSLLQEEITC